MFVIQINPTFIDINVKKLFSFFVLEKFNQLVHQARIFFGWMDFIKIMSRTTYKNRFNQVFIKLNLQNIWNAMHLISKSNENVLIVIFHCNNL